MNCLYTASQTSHANCESVTSRSSACMHLDVEVATNMPATEAIHNVCYTVLPEHHLALWQLTTDPDIYYVSAAWLRLFSIETGH